MQIIKQAPVSQSLANNIHSAATNRGQVQSDGDGEWKLLEIEKEDLDRGDLN